MSVSQPGPMSGSSSSPPDLRSPTLHAVTTNQSQIMSMDDEDFSTDDEHPVSAPTTPIGEHTHSHPHGCILHCCVVVMRLSCTCVHVTVSYCVHTLTCTVIRCLGQFHRCTVSTYLIGHYFYVSFLCKFLYLRNALFCMFFL